VSGCLCRVVWPRVQGPMAWHGRCSEGAAAQQGSCTKVRTQFAMPMMAARLHSTFSGRKTPTAAAVVRVSCNQGLGRILHSCQYLPGASACSSNAVDWSQFSTEVSLSSCTRGFVPRNEQTCQALERTCNVGVATAKCLQYCMLTDAHYLLLLLLLLLLQCGE
jgi:hypothetical protein